MKNFSELNMALTKDNWIISYSIKDDKYTITDPTTIKYLTFGKCSKGYYITSCDELMTLYFKTIRNLYDGICFAAHCL